MRLIYPTVGLCAWLTFGIGLSAQADTLLVSQTGLYDDEEPIWLVDGGLVIQQCPTEGKPVIPLFAIGGWKGMPEELKHADYGYMVHPEAHHVFLREPMYFGKKTAPQTGRVHVAWILSDRGPILRHAIWNTPDIYEKETWGSRTRPGYAPWGFVCEEPEGLRLCLWEYRNDGQKQVLPPQNWFFKNESMVGIQTETKKIQHLPVPSLNYGDAHGLLSIAFPSTNSAPQGRELRRLPDEWRGAFHVHRGLAMSDVIELDVPLFPKGWKQPEQTDSSGAFLFGSPNGHAIVVIGTADYQKGKPKTPLNKVDSIVWNRFDGKQWHSFELPRSAQKKQEWDYDFKKPRNPSAQLMMGCRTDDSCAVVGPYFIVIGDGKDHQYWWLHIPTGESGFAPIPKGITHSIGLYEAKGGKPGDGDHWYQIGEEVWAQPLRGGYPRKVADKVEGEVVGVYDTDQDLSKLTYDMLVKDIPQEYRGRITWKKPISEK